MMFKIILIKRFYNLSDEQAEYLIHDRLSFKEIKAGEGHELWKDKPHKKRQKDIDARWTEKNGEKFYGYKDHAKVDAKSKLIDTMLKGREITSKVIERAYRNKPLTEEQKESNKVKSKMRSRVEHVFGFVNNSMTDFYIQGIGFLRAKGIIGLI